MSPETPNRVRKPVVIALLLATAWLGAVLLAWQLYDLPARPLAPVLALGPYFGILIWARGNPPGP